MSKRKLANGKWRLPQTKERHRLYFKQKGICHWCRRPCYFKTSLEVNFTDKAKWIEYRDLTFTVDHVEPLGGGGTNDQENLVGACFQCNQKRNNSFQATLKSSTAPEDCTC